MKRILMIFIFLVTTFLFFYGCNTMQKDSQQKFDYGKLDPDAPKETIEFGQFVGTWKAEQTIIGKEGSWNGKKTKALWRWYYILEGQAVQDDWISIDSLNQRKAVGTNIRIYNPDEKRWYLAWIDKTNRRLATFTATSDSGQIVMDGTNAQGRHIHNVFYNIKKDTFDWNQEWTFDEGKSWVAVAKINCVRIKE